MNTEEKLKKIKELADKMYSRMAYLTSDTRPIREAMEEYHQFVTTEYHKEEQTIPDIVDEHFYEMLGEEPVSEDLEKELSRLLKDCEIDSEYIHQDFLHIVANHFANWQKEQMMAKAFDFTKEHNIACVLASECLRNHGWFSRERDFNDLFRHLSCVDKLFEGKFSGKTKVIVIKED